MPPERDFVMLRTLIAQGTSLTYEQKWQEAQALFLNVKRAAMKLGDIDAEAWAEQYLGRIERDRGNQDAAMRHYDRALELARSLRETRLAAVVLDQIGGSYAKRKDYERAHDFYQQALRTDPRAASFVKGNLARLHQLMGNVDQAKRLTKESSLAYRTEATPYGPALNHIELAEGAIFENDLITAVEEARRARQMGSSIGHQEAIDAAMVVIHKVTGAFGDDATTFAQVKAVLATQFGEDEEEVETTLWVNACVTLSYRGTLCEAAELYWALYNRALLKNQVAVLDFLRPRRFFDKRPIQKLETNLENQLRTKTAAQDRIGAARLRLGLAECVAAQGKFGAAIKHAQGARELYSKTTSPSDAARCENLIRELSSRIQLSSTR